MAESDREFLEAFERCVLPFEQWNHRAHVRVAYLLLSQLDLPAAIERMRSAIGTYNAANDVPNALDRGYHETVTVAFMRLIHAASQVGVYATSDDFCASQPELLDKSILQRFYSRERIMSWEAKAQFVEPDRAPLPGPPLADPEAS